MSKPYINWYEFGLSCYGANVLTELTSKLNKTKGLRLPIISINLKIKQSGTITLYRLIPKIDDIRGCIVLIQC